MITITRIKIEHEKEKEEEEENNQPNLQLYPKSHTHTHKERNIDFHIVFKSFKRTMVHSEQGTRNGSSTVLVTVVHELQLRSRLKVMMTLNDA